jgi:integrase
LAIPLGDVIHTVLVSPKAEMIEFSLRTSDPAEARMRQAAVVSYLERTWAEIRRGPTKLSHKQVVALAGELYRDFVKAFESNPGSPERWVNVLVENALAAATKTGSGALMIRADAAGARFAKLASLRDRFGGFMEALLARRSLVIDDDSRAALLEQVARVMDEAALRLMANAEGDYRPDQNAERFPTWAQATPQEVPSPAAGSSKAVTTFDDLFARWKLGASPAPSTVTTWRSYIRAFADFLGHDDPRKVTTADVLRWKDDLLARGRQDIGNTYLAALRAIYNHAVDNAATSGIAENPAKGVVVRQKKKAGTRRLPYEAQEVARILAAAKAETSEVRRWMPWLVALTGARVGEIAQLWATQVVTIDEVPCLRIAPAEDGGTLKTEVSERDVPIHPAILETGFLDYVKTRKGRPLFYAGTGRKAGNSADDDSRRHPSKSVSNRLAQWIRGLGFDDARKAPNHAFRHWFKSECIRVEIPDGVADALQGHSSGRESDTYRHIDAPTKLRYLAKIVPPALKGPSS